MPTFDGLVEAVIGELHAWTNSQEQHATLLADIDSNDLAFSLDDTTAAGKGLYEINEEIVYVKVGSSQDGSMAVPAWGRAQQGSVAASHAAGSRVTRAPRFPRHRVKALINESIQQIYPALYGIAVTEFASTSIETQYELPAACVRVLSVEYQLNDSTQTWVGVRRWKLDTEAPTDEFPSGVSLTLGDLPIGGFQTRVHYATEPTVLVAGSDDFTTTGLRASVADLIRIAVIARLVVGPEVARGQITSVEQTQRSQLVQTGSTTSVARYFHSLYEKKLLEEQRALRARVPARVVRTWT